LNDQEDYLADFQLSSFNEFYWDIKVYDAFGAKSCKKGGMALRLK